MELTLAQLRAIMPRLPEAAAAEYLPHLDGAMREFQISHEPTKIAPPRVSLAVVRPASSPGPATRKPPSAS